MSHKMIANVLPPEYAEAVCNLLKSSSKDCPSQSAFVARTHDFATVAFGDIVGFTALCQLLSPPDLISTLDAIFSTIDELCTVLAVEKIKTIGDCYMCAAICNETGEDGKRACASKVMEVCLGMHDVVRQYSHNEQNFQVRAGMDCGVVIAGIIGKIKFSYDIWGDVVNTAARMESTGTPGMTQVTANIHTVLHTHYDFVERGEVQVKGKGVMNTYLHEHTEMTEVMSEVMTTRRGSISCSLSLQAQPFGSGSGSPVSPVASPLPRGISHMLSTLGQSNSVTTGVHTSPLGAYQRTRTDSISRTQLLKQSSSQPQLPAVLRPLSKTLTCPSLLDMRGPGLGGLPGAVSPSLQSLFRIRNMQGSRSNGDSADDVDFMAVAVAKAANVSFSKNSPQMSPSPDGRRSSQGLPQDFNSSNAKGPRIRHEIEPDTRTDVSSSSASCNGVAGQIQTADSKSSKGAGSGERSHDSDLPSQLNIAEMMAGAGLWENE